MNAIKEIRAGMLSWAHVHAEFRTKALLEMPGVRVVAVADDNLPRGEAAGRRWGIPDVYQDWRRLVERKDIDVVFVHSENNRHAEQVIMAAEAGKDIFCEKPMATSLEDAQRMLDAVRKNRVQLVVAFVSRFAKEAERARRIVETGVLGEIVSARSIIGLAGIREIGCPADMEAWMVDPIAGGGGAWIDEGSHAVDLLRWMVGDVEAVCLSTVQKVKRHLQVEDEAIGLLRFRNGALGEVNTSWSLAIDVGMRNAIELYGSQGSLFLESTSSTPKVSLYTEKLPSELRGWVTPHIIPEVTEPHDYQSWPPNVHHYKREIASFVSRYQKGELPFGPSGEDGRACLAVLLAGYRSAKSGSFITL